MAQMQPTKHNLSEFNGGTGEEYGNQIFPADDFTKMAENSAYASNTAYDASTVANQALEEVREVIAEHGTVVKLNNVAQAVLNMDTTPTENSNNGITSGGVFDALQNISLNSYYGHFDKTSFSTVKWSNMTPLLVADENSNNNFEIVGSSSGNDSSYLKCKTAGKYLVIYSMSWDLNSSMLSFLRIVSAKPDGSGYTITKMTEAYESAYIDGSTYRRGNTLCGIFDLDVNDRLYMGIYTDSDSNTISFKSNYYNNFIVIKLKEN